MDLISIIASSRRRIVVPPNGIIDVASNYAVGEWIDGSNKGNGFNSWDLDIVSGGNFVGTASVHGANAAPLDTGGKSFGLYNDDSTGVARAIRGFNWGSPGSTFSTQIAYQFDNGNRGFKVTAGGSEVFNLNINSGGYSWTGGGSAATTPWVGIREFGVLITITISITPTGLNYSFASAQSSIGGVSGSIVCPQPNGLEWYVTGAGGGTGGDFYFNSLVGNAVPFENIITDLQTNDVSLLQFAYTPAGQDPIGAYADPGQVDVSVVNFSYTP
jgi:hypothetical protein